MHRDIHIQSVFLMHFVVSDVFKKRQNQDSIPFCPEFVAIHRDFNHTLKTQSNNNIRLKVHLFLKQYMVYTEQYDMNMIIKAQSATSWVCEVGVCLCLHVWPGN